MSIGTSIVPPPASVRGSHARAKIAIEERAGGVAELRAQTDQAAPVGRLCREGASRQVVDARANVQPTAGARDQRHARYQRPDVDSRARHRAGDRIAEVVVVPDFVPD